MFAFVIVLIERKCYDHLGQHLDYIYCVGLCYEAVSSY